MKLNVLAETNLDFDPLMDSLKNAINRITPSWPLSSQIAVNPLWDWRDLEFNDALKIVSRLSGSSLELSLREYQNWFLDNKFTRSQLEIALREEKLNLSIEDCLNLLDLKSKNKISKLKPQSCLYIDHVEKLFDHQQTDFYEFMINELSSFCTMFFSENTEKMIYSDLNDSFTDSFNDWLQSSRQAKNYFGPTLLKELIREDSSTIRKYVFDILDRDPELIEKYYTALLLRINGWSSWCSYLDFQINTLGGVSSWRENILNSLLKFEYLAIRLLKNYSMFDNISLSIALEDDLDGDDKLKDLFRACRRALEISHISNVGKVVRKTKPQKEEISRPDFQMVFCIDVRSEPLRRSLELEESSLQTLGFAGFFGLPINFENGKSSVQLSPGIVPPQINVSKISRNQNSGVENIESVLTRSKNSFRNILKFSSSAYLGVELFGLSYLNDFFRGLSPKDPEIVKKQNFHEVNSNTNLPTLVINNKKYSDLVPVVANILKQLFIVDNFAKCVVFIGHGSSSVNNPHAASLECGACCGHKGDINAALLAQILNDQEIRLGLLDFGINIPSDTVFIYGLHDTTTQKLNINVKYSLDKEQQELVSKLLRITDKAAKSLSEETFNKNSINRADYSSPLNSNLEQRSKNWSETRPEPGLLGNASFIIAPRRFTSNGSLNGESFLNEYHHCHDLDGKILEGILTAPMLVAHWINMQYFFSTMDNKLFGSGNKVLHNVMIGNIGVLEGNEGDLRIGLPYQSVFYDEKALHKPRRLSVLINAPLETIDGIVEKHEMLKQLIFNEWIHLYRVDDLAHTFQKKGSKNWFEVNYLN